MPIDKLCELVKALSNTARGRRKEGVKRGDDGAEDEQESHGASTRLTGLASRRWFQSSDGLIMSSIALRVHLLSLP